MAMLKDFFQFFISRCEAIDRVCQRNGFAVYGKTPLQFLNYIFFDAFFYALVLIAIVGIVLLNLSMSINIIAAFIFLIILFSALMEVIFPLFFYIILLPLSFFGQHVVGNDKKMLSSLLIITVVLYAISIFVLFYMTGALDAYVLSFSFENWTSNFNSVVGALFSLVIVGIFLCIIFFTLINIFALSVIYWDLKTFFGHTSDEFPHAKKFIELSLIYPGQQFDHEELFILANIEANWSGIVVCSYFSIMAILFWLMVVTQKTVNFFKDRD